MNEIRNESREISISFTVMKYYTWIRGIVWDNRSDKLIK